MSFEIAIKVENLSKCYHIYDQPRDRLKQMILPRLQRAIGMQARQYFREFWALGGVSFEVKKGETIGIIGRNGSGKSTLLQMICGTLNPTSGSIETRGRIAALLELGSGFNPEFTGRENVYLNGSVLGLSSEEIDARFDDIAAFADIGEFIERPVKTFSSGMYVRLAFAVQAMVDPDILVVDEALAVGDEKFQRKCFARLEELKSEGASILFVSHSGGTIVELCDRAILIDAGEKLAEGLPKLMVGRYQKLLYAPPNMEHAIRDQIRRLVETQGDIVGKDEPATGESVVRVLHSPAPQESYDPSLKPDSTIEYGPEGTIIEMPLILTLSGEMVNNLIRGKTYRYTYRARFEKNASNVRFGMLIKTTSGVELGGAITALSPAGGIPFVEAGATYQVEFRFNANLNSGVYFMNAGIVGHRDGQPDQYLRRSTDIAMFRILPDGDSYATALVDFGCVPEIQLMRAD